MWHWEKAMKNWSLSGKLGRVASMTIWRTPALSWILSHLLLQFYFPGPDSFVLFYFLNFGSSPVLTTGEPLYGASAVPVWCIGPAQSCCSAGSTAPSPSPAPGRTLQEGEGQTQLLRLTLSGVLEWHTWIEFGCIFWCWWWSVIHLDPLVYSTCTYFCMPAFCWRTITRI